MQTDDLVQQLIALPLLDRITVAQALWQSIDESEIIDTANEQHKAVETARRRDRELTDGAVAGRSHEDMMEAVRRALECG